MVIHTTVTTLRLGCKVARSAFPSMFQGWDGRRHRWSYLREMEFSVDVEGCTESWRGGVCPECQGRHIPLEGSVSGGVLWQFHWYSESYTLSLTSWLDSYCYECSYFLSFPFPLLQTYQTPLLLFPFPLCRPQTSICLPFALWLLYLDMTHYDLFNESYLLLDLRTSDDSLYESSLYLAHDSYRLWLTHSYY